MSFVKCPLPDFAVFMVDYCIKDLVALKKLKLGVRRGAQNLGMNMSQPRFEILLWPWLASNLYD